MIKQDHKFFNLFFYIKERLHASKQFLVECIKESARERFQAKMAEDIPELQHQNLKISDIKNQNVYVNQKFDTEFKLSKLKANWQQEEMLTLLQFLNAMCENCFRPAQIFLRKQGFDEGESA